MAIPTPNNVADQLKEKVEHFLKQPKDDLYLEICKLIQVIYFQSEEESQKNVISGKWIVEEINLGKRDCSEIKVRQEVEDFLANPSCHEKANSLSGQLYLCTEAINFQAIQQKPTIF